MDKIAVIIVAGGKGTRAGSGIPKQFAIAGQLPVLAHAINAFAAALPAAPRIVVLPVSHMDYWRDLSARFPIARHQCVEGGAERADSVRAGLKAVPFDAAFVAIHDGARPLLTSELILRTVDCAVSHGSAVPVIPVADSLRRVVSGSSKAVSRADFCAVQTPQVFARAVLDAAYALPTDAALTDDASIVQAAGFDIALCQGEPRNRKITTSEDLLAARALLEYEKEL